MQHHITLNRGSARTGICSAVASGFMELGHASTLHNRASVFAVLDGVAPLMSADGATGFQRDQTNGAAINHILITLLA